MLLGGYPLGTIEKKYEKHRSVFLKKRNARIQGHYAFRIVRVPIMLCKAT
jgi:hypothetical protein